MQIAWLVNISLPDVLNYLNKEQRGSGWWIAELAKTLVSTYDVKLTIITCSPKFPHSEASFTANGIQYKLIKARLDEITGIRSKMLLKKLSNIINSQSFDVVDVHGTEYVYGQIIHYTKIPVIITLQGFVNEVMKNPFGSNSFWKNIFFQIRNVNDLKESIINMRNLYYNKSRSKNEIEIISQNRYFLGRTAFDNDQVNKYSPIDHLYYSAHRILRPIFYSTIWKPVNENIDLFCCGRAAPYKGYQDVINILPDLCKANKSVSLRLGGVNSNGWGGYLNNLSKKLNVNNNVLFLGNLSAERIAEELTLTKLYIHPSYADNSPNSLAEAMCVGVPCIATTTGGIPSMIENNVNGLLYAPGNRDELIRQIRRLLNDRQFAAKLGANARKTALDRHDPQKIVSQVYACYEDIVRRSAK